MPHMTRSDERSTDIYICRLLRHFIAIMPLVIKLSFTNEVEKMENNFNFTKLSRLDTTYQKRMTSVFFLSRIDLFLICWYIDFLGQKFRKISNSLMIFHKGRMLSSLLPKANELCFQIGNKNRITIWFTIWSNWIKDV